jgi:hypothetical protein
MSLTLHPGYALRSLEIALQLVPADEILEQGVALRPAEREFLAPAGAVGVRCGTRLVRRWMQHRQSGLTQVPARAA